ncbi:MAG TPA: hypothetical protein VJ276_03185 [Thermoanaerobaculia bacterium]|nr:hypothetical protein [Thermoanaerobaculia bacterium]
MKLHIGRTTNGDTWTSKYWLRDPDGGDLGTDFVEPHLAQQRIGTLSQRWFVLYARLGDVDRNELLLRDIEDVNPLLGDLVTATRKNNVFKFTHVDPVIHAAVEERVRRALAMIAVDDSYGSYLDLTREEHMVVGSDEAKPSGEAVYPSPSAPGKKPTS